MEYPHSKVGEPTVARPGSPEQRGVHRDFPGASIPDHWRCTNCGTVVSFHLRSSATACTDCGNIHWHAI